jgi:hypothetical protein
VTPTTSTAVIAALSDAHEWLACHPPGLSGSFREAERQAVLDSIRTLVNEVSRQEQLVYVLPVDAKTQQHLRRVPGGKVGK